MDLSNKKRAALEDDLDVSINSECCVLDYNSQYPQPATRMLAVEFWELNCNDCRIAKPEKLDECNAIRTLWFEC